MNKSIITILLLFLAFPGFSQKYSNTWESIDSRPVPSWVFKIEI